MTIILNCSKSENMLCSTPTKILEKHVAAGTTEFFMHSMKIPSKGNYKRIAECKVKHVDE